MVAIAEGSPASGSGSTAGSASGRAVRVDWNGRPVEAWVPSELAERDLALPASVVRESERAVAALRLADHDLPPAWEALARLLLRHEGIASSGIEGLREPIVSVLIAEQTNGGGAAGWVADNLAVIDTALSEAELPLSVEMLHGWHARLMRNSDLPPSMMGAFRASISWVGGSLPVDAAYVPPPPTEIPRLVDDLLRFADGGAPINDPTIDGTQADPLDAVARAAIAHAQFEAIHPYADGNGRIGRVLVSRILRRGRATQRATAPISLAIARDPGGYLSGLRLFEEGNTAAWVRWFAEIAGRAARTTDTLVTQSQELIKMWTEATSTLRADSAARALLPLLPGHPIINSTDVATLLGVSERAGRNALDALVSHGVLEPIDATPAQSQANGPGRPHRWHAAPDLLRLWQT